MTAQDLRVDVAGIRIVGLYHGYPNRNVFCDFNLAIDRRGVVGLLGPNGAGKTTLLRVLATADTPRRGVVEVLGVDLADRRSRHDLRRTLGFLPQTFGYIPHFTVREFVEYVGWLREIPSQEISVKVANAIDAVELTQVAQTKMSKLSGGMLRRVGIAQAIVNEPQLLILDEPTAGLDPEQRVAFRQLIRDIGSRALVILATHLVEDVAAACDDIVVLYDGEVAFRGDANALTMGAALGATGDTPLERGYTSVISRRKGAK